MAKLTTDELLDAFKEMTLIELSEFVKLFEDTFGVTAAAPVAVAAAAAPAGAGDGADAAEVHRLRQGVVAALDVLRDLAALATQVKHGGAGGKSGQGVEQVRRTRGGACRDCAHGTSFRVGAAAVRRDYADWVEPGASPDGRRE